MSANCSFCGKSVEIVKRMIYGHDDIFICDECVALCHEAIVDHLHKDCVKFKQENKLLKMQNRELVQSCFMEFYGTDR